MTNPANVHNAIGLLVDLYGGMLKDQAEEILRLRQQNEYLTQALRRASLPTEGAKADDRKDVAGVPGQVRGRVEEPVAARPVEGGGGEAPRAGGADEAHQGLGEVQGKGEVKAPYENEASLAYERTLPTIPKSEMSIVQGAAASAKEAVANLLARDL